jgi:hypothetical protein
MLKFNVNTGLLLASAVLLSGLVSCASPSAKTTETDTTKKVKFLAKPLITDIYTADPSAHVFNNKIYIYPSHDIDAGIPENDNGDHFAMNDYHILSMDSIGGKVTDHGVAWMLKISPGQAASFGPPMRPIKTAPITCTFP